MTLMICWQGNLIPKTVDAVSLSVFEVIPKRTDALAKLSVASISPKYTGAAGAIPLIGSDTLKKDTVFYRFLSSSSDPRYATDALTGTNQLSAGTYLTTRRDQRYANTGFATVGRFALPIPRPASYVHRYELPAGTTIDVGTVAPMFGQAGGGVEVHLPTTQSATLLGSSQVPDY
jgi:Tuberculosis necrotizing toxin